MANDLCISEGRISSSQNPDKLCKSFVLDVLVRRIVGTLELYTDRKVIALRAATIPGFARMPGSLVEWDVLCRLALARDHYVARDTQIDYLSKIGMLLGHEPVRKELIDGRTTKLPRRETNAVDNEKFQCRAGWPLVAVWRGDPPHTFKPSCVGFYLPHFSRRTASRVFRQALPPGVPCRVSVDTR